MARNDETGSFLQLPPEHMTPPGYPRMWKCMQTYYYYYYYYYYRSANPKPEAIGHTRRASAATSAGPSWLADRKDTRSTSDIKV